MNLILDKYLPLKKLIKQKLKFKTKPWITPGLQKSISVKNKLLTKFIKLKEPTLKNEAQTKYKFYRNMLATLLKRSKHTYFSSFFQNHVNDLKNTWKDIKRIISLKDSRSTVPSNNIEDNISLTNPKDIADAFNNYFSNVATGIKSSMKYSRNKFFDFLPQININSFFIKPTDKTEIKNIILSLDPLKSIGPNSIPTKILKLLSNHISTQFAELFNLSFSEGVFLSILKTCKVIPIYKKDSQLNCSNYRPIPLLSNIDKILERIMYNRLYKFLETNNLIYSLQFEFRQKHSTSHALIHLTDKIREQLDKENFACGVFVNFQKAFDTVDHQILIQKLNYYGIRGIANNWFCSYLQNRTQFVSINDFGSNVNAICCGVPQGSIPGRLLFLIYINGLQFAIKYCKVHHFADDTNLLNFNNFIRKINKQVVHDLKYISYWLNANKICLNFSKTEVVLSESVRKQTKATLKLKLNGKRLHTTNSVKYLGIKIDENLNWHEQINNVAIFESHLFYSCLL